MGETPDPISTGARAAALLEEACRSAPEPTNPLQLEVVRDLALDIGRQLDALSGLARVDAAPHVLAEAAIYCADLANLAACNAPELPPEEAARAVAAARRAAAAVNELRTLVEVGSGEGEHVSNLLRDVRSAAWRAEFASRQVGGAPD